MIAHTITGIRKSKIAHSANEATANGTVIPVVEQITPRIA